MVVGAFLVGIVGLTALSVIVSGFVLTVLWGWFIVPTFDAPELNVTAAIGLALVVKFLTYSASSSDDDDSGEAFVVSLLFPIFALIFDWVVHLFM